MINRIEVSSRISITQAINVYTIKKNLNKNQLKEIALSLTNPVYQKFTINKPTLISKFTWAIETGFLPGVTDNVANTVKEIIKDQLKIKFVGDEDVFSSQLLLIDGKLEEKDVIKISQGLINPLINRIHFKSQKQYLKDNGMNKIAPQVKLTSANQVDEVNLNISDEELTAIGKSGIKNKESKWPGQSVVTR